MKSLVIAEKPSVARDIARVLKCTRKSATSIEGDKYIVTWGLGHLVTLASPESYHIKYKEWKMEDLPMLPDRLNFEVIPQTKKQYNAVKACIHRKDVKDIIIATDAGREGELVARLILELARNTKDIKRLWISSVTDKAIKEGFAKLKPGKDYIPLYKAALSRSEADWLVGLNATRALTCKYNAQLSCGRVQTPTLAMVAARENEIKNFKPKPYYGMTTSANGIFFVWKDSISGGTRSFDKTKVEGIFQKVKGEALSIREVQKIKKKTYAPNLYDLTELQRDANKRFHFSAKETLNIMQRLYENHKVLTYPRTDSRYISSDIVPTLKERLKACGVGPYKALAGKLMQTPFSAKSSFVNDSKVTDHHAIIPTEQFVQMANMTNEEKKIYDLVVKRFLAVLYPPFEYEQTTILASVKNETFAAQGKIVLKMGFKEVYENVLDDDDDAENDMKEQKLPNISKGEILKNPAYKLTEGKTKPPLPFTEATILSAMENPTKYLSASSKEVAKTLTETGGLGTVATRADILEKLFSSFLLEKKGNALHTTSKAKQLLTIVPTDLKQPELTADWEMKLSKIAKGSMKREVFMQEIRSYTVALTKQIQQGTGTFRHDNLSGKKCPNCGKHLLSVNGKKSKMLVCQDRECGYRETLAITSNARCPVCHKKMEMIGKDDASIFVCGCGHKEKLAKFQERRKKEGAGVTKKDVQQYMNQQKRESEPVNNPFADAFNKIKL
jgi:DNA topoisomerase III, bacteria and conjugative plasmid